MRDKERRIKDMLLRRFAMLVRYAIRERRMLLRATVAVVFTIAVVYGLFFQAPYSFSEKITVTIPDGTSLDEAATILKDNHIIRSKFLYKTVNVLLGNQSSIQAGDYYFNDRQDLFAVTGRLVTGDYGLTPRVVRIPEGATIFSIADQFDSHFNHFDQAAFVSLALKEDAEGYLFPDTYRFLPNVSERAVYRTLRENFNEQIATITDQIDAFGAPLPDVIIMASLIEKESGQDMEERRTIAGILWNRIKIGMALQVDAVFPYINGKNTYELSTDDLDVDSPYNTYKYPGLPAGPISNPSLESILAAVTPIETNYLYYLHDAEGNVHYSTTFEGHKQNKFKYLR